MIYYEYFLLALILNIFYNKINTNKINNIMDKVKEILERAGSEGVSIALYSGDVRTSEDMKAISNGLRVIVGLDFFV